MINRRSVITGLISLVAAPAIVRVSSHLMPINPRLVLPRPMTIYVDAAIEDWQPLFGFADGKPTFPTIGQALDFANRVLRGDGGGEITLVLEPGVHHATDRIV